MAISHVSRGLTVSSREVILMKDVESDKVYNLTSVVEATDNNTVEIDNNLFQREKKQVQSGQPEIIMPSLQNESFSFEISWPNTVLPVPENKSGADIILTPNIQVTNNTAHLVQIESDTFIPELIRANGQVLQPQVDSHLPPKNPECIFIKPRMNTLIGIQAKLSWQNDRLRLSGSNVGKVWFFNDLKPETYQMRFTYRRSLEGVSCSGKETSQLRRGEDNWVKQGDTRSVTLRLVTPTATDSSAVEVDGIRFKTVILKPVLTIPENQPNSTTLLQLGIRLTNNTPKSISFPQTQLRAALKRVDGSEVRQGCVSDSSSQPQKIERVLVQPKETATILSEGKLLWIENRLQIRMSDSFFDFCFYDNLKPGIYQVQIGYNILIEELSSEDSLTNPIVRLQDIWNGLVVTPPADLRLVQK